MRQEQARDIGLFFLLGLMDERVALAAAGRAIARIKASEKSVDELVPPSQLIKICREFWKSHRKQSNRIHSTGVSTEGSDGQQAWIVPVDLDIGLWARYQRDAPDEDVATILFSMVLGLSDDELAEGFETSVGTIRYRLGKGIRQLGLVARGQKPVLSSGSGQ